MAARAAMRGCWRSSRNRAVTRRRRRAAHGFGGADSLFGGAGEGGWVLIALLTGAPPIAVADVAIIA
jgi:hypothetical protein